MKSKNPWNWRHCVLSVICFSRYCWLIIQYSNSIHEWVNKCTSVDASQCTKTQRKVFVSVFFLLCFSWVHSASADIIYWGIVTIFDGFSSERSGWDSVYWFYIWQPALRPLSPAIYLVLLLYFAPSIRFSCPPPPHTLRPRCLLSSILWLFFMIFSPLCLSPPLF